MANILNELEADYKKSGLLNQQEIPISYRLGFPILDENLGGKYIRKGADGKIYTTIRVGIPAGTITQIGGASSTGKTTAAIQMSWNIVEPFGEEAQVIHIDEENATLYDRVAMVTGAPMESIRAKYRIVKPPNTWESTLELIQDVCKKKEELGATARYNTHVKDFQGNEIEYFVPTVVLIDSVMAITSKAEDVTEISGLTSAGRETIYRNKFLRNVMKYLGRYNINIIMINHTANDMDLGKPGGGSKQFTFIETGKKLPGGDKLQAWSTSIIIFKPVNSKDQIKHEESEGYNGLPCKAMVVKSRSSIGGTIATQEFSQEYGYDPKLTLMNFAKERGLIAGRNPKCYFTCNPDVTFDTRIFLKEMEKNPEIMRTLAQECRPELDKLIPVFDLTEREDDMNPISSGKVRREFRDILRDMYSQE